MVCTTETMTPPKDCLVCGNAVQPEEDRVRCPECRAEFRRGADGRLSGIEEAGIATYPTEGNERTLQVEDTSFWFRHRNRILDAVLDRYPPGGRLWDVGGGNGFQALHFAKKGLRVVLVEPGPVGCRNAERRGVSDIVQSTLESLRLPSDRLDAISLLDVVEHLPEPARLLVECRRVLKPEGRLYLTVPAFGFLWSDEDDYACHQRRYTRATLSRDVREAGFRIEYVTYFFQILVLPILVFRTLPYRLLRRRKDPRGATMDPTEHAPGRRSEEILAALLSHEPGLIRRGRTLGFGSSLVAVAKRD
jgi:ubiquinone/menaquinone biosynthesis C-methylase UbiE